VPSIGSVSVNCSIGDDPRRRTIFAPKVSTSCEAVSTVAPSMAVSPATASTARVNSSRQARGDAPAAGPPLSEASSANAGAMA
jgi:hypothetical protein